MSLYIIVSPGGPQGSCVLVENKRGLYEDLEMAKQDLVEAAHREERLDLILYRLNGYTMEARDLVNEYSLCPGNKTARC